MSNISNFEATDFLVSHLGIPTSDERIPEFHEKLNILWKKLVGLESNDSYETQYERPLVAIDCDNFIASTLTAIADPEVELDKEATGLRLLSKTKNIMNEFATLGLKFMHNDLDMDELVEKSIGYFQLLGLLNMISVHLDKE